MRRVGDTHIYVMHPSLPEFNDWMGGSRQKIRDREREICDTREKIVLYVEASMMTIENNDRCKERGWF